MHVCWQWQKKNTKGGIPMLLTDLQEFLLMVSVCLALFAVPIVILTIIGKIFKIKSINETLRW